jgi:hypothetical protein
MCVEVQTACGIDIMSVLLHLHGDTLRNYGNEFITKILSVFYILVYILKHTF